MSPAVSGKRRDGLQIPPSIAQAFLRDLRRYHATKDKDKRTRIAAWQMEALSKYQKVTMEEVYQLFREMRKMV